MTRKALVGVDFAEKCRLAGKALREDHEANFQKRQNMREAAERKAIEGQHKYCVKLVRVLGGHWQASTLEHPPFVGQLSALGHSEESALKELRFAYATKLHEKGLLPDFDDARRHACKAQWIRELDLHVGL